MTAKNTETTEQTESKPTRLERAKARFTSASDETSKPKSTLGQKAKNVAAVIGAVTVVGVAAAAIAKKKSVGVEVTLPDLDVTTDV